MQKLQAQLSALDFQFKNPESGFDRSRVKGVVAKLLRVQDVSANSALEVIAGGKLYQVVVDTADCAKALLQKGQLRNRVTIIPLDKISSRTLSQDKIKTAKQQSEEVRDAPGQRNTAQTAAQGARCGLEAVQQVQGRAGLEAPLPESLEEEDRWQ